MLVFRKRKAGREGKRERGWEKEDEEEKERERGETSIECLPYALRLGIESTT